MPKEKCRFKNIIQARGSIPRFWQIEAVCQTRTNV